MYPIASRKLRLLHFFANIISYCVCMLRFWRKVDLSGGFVCFKAIATDFWQQLNILPFLSDPHFTIPNLLQDLEYFQKLSNLKMNYIKLQALNVFLFREKVLCCKTNFPFSWCTEALTYIGIQIEIPLYELFRRNHSVIMEECVVKFAHGLISMCLGLVEWRS